MAPAESDLDTFPKWLRHHARTRGDRPAIREKRRGIWQTLSWAQLEAEVRALATALLDSGFQRGGHVAFVGDNRPRLYAAMCATQWLGGVAVPLYPDALAAELEHPLALAEASHVFAEDQEQVDKLLPLLPRCPSIARIVYDEDRGMRHYRQPQLVSHEAFSRRGRELLSQESAHLDQEVDRGRRADPAAMFFATAADGPPAGVVLSHGALVDRARTVAALEGLGDADCTVAYLPPAWVGQHVFSYALPMVSGCGICCPESAETMLADLREVGPTYLFAPPRVLQALVDDVNLRMQDAAGPKRALFERAMSMARRVGPALLDGRELGLGDRLAWRLGEMAMFGSLRDVLGMSQLRVVYTAGDAVGADLLAFFRSIGINLKQLYGGAETGLVVCAQPDGQARADTVGPPTAGVELRVTPQREVLVRSAGLFSGYHRDPEATRRVLDGDGWFHTGDAGYLGADGHLRVIDRVRDLGALADGSLFAPRFIESRLERFACVKRALAFGAGRPHAVVLVEIDRAAVLAAAGPAAEALAAERDLAATERVQEQVADCIARVNAELAAEPLLARAQVRRFVVLPETAPADDAPDATTPARARRAQAAEQHRTLLDAVYAGQPRARLVAELRHEDGRSEHVGTELKIRDARVAPVAAAAAPGVPSPQAA